MRAISVSRRTDVPAFYSEWLMNRFRAGFCHWINPYSAQVYRVSLKPEDVLAIAFLSRDPAPLIPHLRALQENGYYFYYHISLLGYPEAIETHNPAYASVIRSFEWLASLIGPENVIWRYDPILISDITPPEYHRAQFARISRDLDGLVRQCYYSFMSMYKKTERNILAAAEAVRPALLPVEAGVKAGLTLSLNEIASKHGMTMHECCGGGLPEAGVEQGHCVDQRLIAALRPELPIHLRRAPTRKGCGCYQATDIGAFDTCMHGCVYCYATNSRAGALRRMAAHDPEDSVLWRPPSLRGVNLSEVEKSQDS